MNFFTPAEVAQNYIATGKSKVSLTIGKMLFLSVFAGVFIARGLCFSGRTDHGASDGKRAVHREYSAGNSSVSA